MAEQTPICDFGWTAVDFDLPGADGRHYRLADARGTKGTLIMFICNHCPYVRAVADRIASDARELQSLGIGVIAIMPNDYRRYPDDAPEQMQAFARSHGFTFPYVIDATQATARAYDAVCTPDFFGFNADLRLQYRGRLDDSAMSPKPAARRELLEAMTQIAQAGEGPRRQTPSIGCSIKWREET
jgi:peroxiredoxin